MACKLSLIIPAKDKEDPKLKRLLGSIEHQDFPKDEVEVLVITEGTSESAKAIGIRRAKGDVIGILASDNEFVRESHLMKLYEYARDYGASCPQFYFRKHSDNLLNRYFALIGGNDPLSYYMRKNDRASHANEQRGKNIGDMTLGDNGFFIKKDLILKTDLDNYYHVDNAHEAINEILFAQFGIYHNTGGSLIDFFKKRYRYGLQHAFNKNRRWHLVDFRRPVDIRRFTWFILASLLIIPPTFLSLRGWKKIRDVAWFLHPVVCLGTVLTYGLLTLHLGLREMSRLLSARSEGLTA